MLVNRGILLDSIKNESYESNGTKNLGFRQTGTISLTGRVDNPRQNELSSSRGLHTPLLLYVLGTQIMPIVGTR